ncbi:hypothetical protein [Lactiplantibacillus herbarum]|uniref:hypothetical protein n=1 Tax=Lactiplantibacillus herbarum TaxID=1670446 RepID=UPI00064FC792|nr:hypothetical protein [Lactiplantibacillus herbarum]
MQVKIITSVVAGQATIAPAKIEAFMDALNEQLGKDYEISLDADYGQSLTEHQADVYLVDFASRANLSADQKAQMIMFYSDEDVDNLLIGRFVDMLQQLAPQK